MADFSIDSVTTEKVAFAVTWKGMLALEHLVGQSKLWEQVREGRGGYLTEDDLTPIIRTIRQAQTEYRLAGGEA